MGLLIELYWILGNEMRHTLLQSILEDNFLFFSGLLGNIKTVYVAFIYLAWDFRLKSSGIKEKSCSQVPWEILWQCFVLTETGQPDREERRGQSVSSRPGGWVLPTFSLCQDCLGVSEEGINYKCSMWFYSVLASCGDDPWLYHLPAGMMALWIVLLIKQKLFSELLKLFGIACLSIHRKSGFSFPLHSWSSSSKFLRGDQQRVENR